MIYLLDTNAISDLMRENPHISAHLRAAAGADRVVTSVIEASQFSEGDLVVFYETAEGEADYVTPKGRGAAVGIARIATGKVEPIEPAGIFEFKKPPKLRFAWEVKCTDHQNGKEIEYERVKAIMDTGDKHSIKGSVKEISQPIFDSFKRELAHVWPCKPTEL
jgi:hypothetical protein